MGGSDHGARLVRQADEEIMDFGEVGGRHRCYVSFVESTNDKKGACFHLLFPSFTHSG